MTTLTRSSGATRGISWFFQEAMPRAGYQIRPSQYFLATHIQHAIRNSEIIMAEAWVGTGKTFAYLVPALVSNPHQDSGVVVATNTILLQEQILEKDIPALRELGFPNLQAFVTKGKGQYLCLQKLYKLADQEGPELETLRTWSETGGYDKTHLTGVSQQTWSRVALDYKTNCRECPIYSMCHYVEARNAWKHNRSVAITNHVQLLQVIQQWQRGYEGLFHKPGVIVIDEAHQFADSVREFLARKISLSDGLTLMEELQKMVDRIGSTEIRHKSELLEQIFTVVLEDLNKLQLERAKGDDDSHQLVLPSGTNLPVEFLSEVAFMGDLISGILSLIRDHVDDGVVTLLLERLYEACSGVITPGTLKWVEVDTTTGMRSLSAVSQDPIEWLETNLYNLGVPIVFSSATLSVEGDFGYIRGQLGLLNRKCTTMSVQGPFDYDKQVKVYTPNFMPQYTWQTSNEYYTKAFQETAKVIEKARGNTLVLLTSKRALREAEAFFQGHPLAAQYPMVFQGDTGVAQAISQFRDVPGSCLFGTAFWEGLDVKGEKLSAVVVPKLPYPVPGPLLDFEVNKARDRGQDPFDAVISPKMILKLRQGLGRLIRSESDQGIVAILDPRFWRRRLSWSSVLPFKQEPKRI